MKLILPPALRARIENEARSAFPRECCGLIEGSRCGEDALATVLHPARNLAAGNDRFEIHPEDHFAALKAARARGQSLIGCYHSHPKGPPRPSAHDRQGAQEEHFLWLIAALDRSDGPVTTDCFVFAKSEFRRIDMSEAEAAEI
jgi:proteasome lid subunit RPN8/RPN11